MMELFSKSSNPLSISIKKVHRRCLLVYVHEIAAVDVSKIYFLENAKKTCNPNTCNLNRDWITVNLIWENIDSWVNVLLKYNNTLTHESWLITSVSSCMLKNFIPNVNLWATSEWKRFESCSDVWTLSWFVEKNCMLCWK